MVKIKNTEAKVTEELNKKADVSKAEEQAAEVKEKAAGSNMVTVACGIPMGLKLNLSDGVLELEGKPMSHIVSAIKGVGYLPAGKYGLTPVTEAQWEEILAKYGKCDFILNGVVFAKKEQAEVVEIAKERSGKDLDKNLGFDQINPKKSPRTKKKNAED